MDKEMESLRRFDVFTETTTTALKGWGAISPTSGALKRKGVAAKARAVAKGFAHRGLDPDATCAPTPALDTAKGAIGTGCQPQLGMPVGWCIHCIPARRTPWRGVYMGACPELT